MSDPKKRLVIKLYTDKDDLWFAQVDIYNENGGNSTRWTKRCASWAEACAKAAQIIFEERR